MKPTSSCTLQTIIFVGSFLGISVIIICADDSYYSVQDLLQMHYELKVSDDIDVDICKASGFRGDIAQPLQHHPAIEHYPLPIMDKKRTTPSSSSSSRRRSRAASWRKRQKSMKHQLRKRNRLSRKNNSKIMRKKSKPSHQQRRSRQSRSAIARRENLWEHGIIPYEIESNFTGEQRALFKQAMLHWENHTCVQFVERQSPGGFNATNYILITIRPCGCCSYVGRRGNGAQAISIGRNCDTFGVVVHELGHALGFYHEHTRPDRDAHVRVLMDNIVAGRQNNFARLTDGEVDTDGQPYDYTSIMHYADNQLARADGLKTLHVLDERFGGMIGQRRQLSEGDVRRANALYRCATCGRTMQESSGAFEAPMVIASTQNDGLHCEWRISTTAGERIDLTLDGLQLGNASASCDHSYLEIRDGFWSGSPVIQKFCASNATAAEQLLQTTSNRMLITLRQAANVQLPAGQRAFRATYETVCGGTLFVNATSGRIESPNYPAQYPPHKECIWLLSVPAGDQVVIQFDAFDLESHSECAFDSVELRDGANASAPLLGRYCGFETPAAIRSNGSQMWVRFTADKSTQRAGFAAAILRERDECALGEHSCEHSCENTLGSYRCTCESGFDLHSNRHACETQCGRIIDLRDRGTAEASGTIVSPSFPALYPNNKECTWEIWAPKHKRITLRVTHFDLEDYAFQTHDCDADSLLIESLAPADGRAVSVHGVHCGARPIQPVLSTTARLRLVFRSDRTIQKGGFALIYGLDVDECAANNGGCMQRCKNTIGGFECACEAGTVLHANGLDCLDGGCRHEVRTAEGRVASPNWPAAYPPESHCRWHFQTAPGHRVRFRFEQFDVEGSGTNCETDRVAFYNGRVAGSITIGVFCGQQRPGVVLSSGRDLWMEFQSDVSGQRAGFRGTHTSICGGRWTASAEPQQIYSHTAFGADQYEADSRCDWVLQAPDFGQSVRVWFEDFELEAQPDCEFDYVEIYDGEEGFEGDRRGRWCGKRQPAAIVSSMESLLVRFRSDGEHSAKGWVLNYVLVEGELEGEDDMDLY